MYDQEQREMVKDKSRHLGLQRSLSVTVMMNVRVLRLTTCNPNRSFYYIYQVKHIFLCSYVLSFSSDITKKC